MVVIRVCPNCCGVKAITAHGGGLCQAPLTTLEDHLYRLNDGAIQNRFVPGGILGESYLPCHAAYGL